MSVDTIRLLAISDVKGLLSIISDTFAVYDYPTSSIFSALSHCAIVSFLIGKYEDVADIEGESVLVFRQLNDFANESSEHEWFVEWSRKLVELVRERKLSQE